MLNQIKLDGCEGLQHDFQPDIDDDGSASIYVCLKCGGKVEAMIGLRYILTGSFEDGSGDE